MMNLEELASWAHQAGQEAEVAAPLAIHGSDYGDGGHDWRVRTGELIGGKPFSKTFLCYVDGDHRAMTPIRRALRRMKSSRGPQTLEFRICWAIVEAGYIYGDVPTLFRADPNYLRAFALRGLALLWDLTQRERDLEPKRTPSSSPNDSGTVPTKGTRPHSGSRRGPTLQSRTAPNRDNPRSVFLSREISPRPAA